MPKLAFAESPGSTGKLSARTPGAVVGSEGTDNTGVGPAIAVGAIGELRSVHDAKNNAIPAQIHAFLMRRFIVAPLAAAYLFLLL
jgi:hypothetical protein